VALGPKQSQIEICSAHLRGMALIQGILFLVFNAFVLALLVNIAGQFFQI